MRETPQQKPHTTRNKLNDLEIISMSKDYHMIGVTESRLDMENRYFLADF